MARRAVEVAPESKKADDLELGKSYVGKVLEVNEYGATLDLGLDMHGWLHRRNLEMPEGIENPAQVLKKDDELTVRVKQVKRSSVDLTMLDDPEFQKKPLSEYKEGDVLEGRVKTIRPQAIFVDVGAMVDGYLPRENLKGATPGQFQADQQLKVRVETVTNNRITLALEEVEKLRGSAEELVLGQAYTAKVLEVNKYGATLDLGLDKGGWLPKQYMAKPEGMSSIDPNEVMKKDDEVTVRIKKVKRNEVDLTMIDIPAFQKKPLSDFQVGDELEASVRQSIAQGVFLDVGAMVDGYLPQRRLNGVELDTLEKGQKVKVKVVTIINASIILELTTQ